MTPRGDVRDVDLLACENEPAGLDLACEQDVVDEIDKPLGLVEMMEKRWRRRSSGTPSSRSRVFTAP